MCNRAWKGDSGIFQKGLIKSSDSACMKIVGILEDYPSVKCNIYQYGKLIFMRE
jgi:hypothetical protein